MLAVLLSALAVSADPEPAPRSAEPCVLTASVQGDKLTLRVTQAFQVHVEEMVKVEKNGKAEEVKVNKVRPEMRTIQYQRDLKAATFTTAGGKKLTLDDVRKRLDRPQPVVVSGDGKAVGAAFLKLFDKDAIVVVLPLSELRVVDAQDKKPQPAPPTPKKD
jgi:hypothetical protein